MKISKTAVGIVAALAILPSVAAPAFSQVIWGDADDYVSPYSGYVIDQPITNYAVVPQTYATVPSYYGDSYYNSGYGVSSGLGSALVGGALGAGIGALVGGHHALRDAGIGAGIGAGLGLFGAGGWF